MATYRVHTFTTSANLVISSLGLSEAPNVEVLLVAGGGGGGSAGSPVSGPAPVGLGPMGGGGGAGGLIHTNVTINSTGSYSIIIGGGGIGEKQYSLWPTWGGGAPYTVGRGTPGNNTTAFSIVTQGGGGGGKGGGGPWPGGPPDDTATGFPGGSGGGGTYTMQSSTVRAGASGIPGQGNPGGNGPPTGYSSTGTAGGGGGAGEAGRGHPASGHGGNGYVIPWVTPDYGATGPAPGRYFAGGGGSGGNSPTIIPTGGFGGGGAGAGTRLAGNTLAVSGSEFTGGGGGGGTTISQGWPSSLGIHSGGDGGSGIVVIRYPYVREPQSKISLVSNVIANISVPGLIDFGSNILFEISTTNASNGESMYYYTSGNASLFSSANTGTLVLNANSATVTLTIASTPGDFTLNVKRNEESSAVLFTSNPISIISAFYNNAIGGNVIIEGDYKLHVFLTSDTFQVLAVGAVDSNISYAVLAGGGGYNDPTQTGGGGGGLIQDTISLAPYGAGNLEIIVGSGGTGSPSASSSPGGRSYIKNSSNALYLEALGGGAVGPTNPGSGGCGGGITGPAAANHPLGIGTGIPGQGFPGGAFSPTTPASQGKAGGGGAGGAGGDGRYISNPVYGVGGDGANIHIAPQGYGYYGASVSPAPQPATPSNRWFGGGGSGQPSAGPAILNTGLARNPAVVVYRPAPSSPSPFGFIPSQRMGTGTGGGGQGELAQSGIVFIKYKYK